MIRMTFAVFLLGSTATAMSLSSSALFLYGSRWLGFSDLTQGWMALFGFVLAFVWIGVVLVAASLRGLADELSLGQAVQALQAIVTAAQEHEQQKPAVNHNPRRKLASG